MTEDSRCGDSSVAIICRRATSPTFRSCQCFPNREAGGDPPERMARYLTGEHHPRQALPPRAMWIAEANGAPIGYAAAARPFHRRLGAVDLNKHWMVWNDMSQIPSLNSARPVK